MADLICQSRFEHLKTQRETSAEEQKGSPVHFDGILKGESEPAFFQVYWEKKKEPGSDDGGHRFGKMISQPEKEDRI